MKNFLNTYHLKYNMILYILQCITLAFLYIVAYNENILKYIHFNGLALFLSCFIWIVSSIADKKLYFNLWTTIISILTGYEIFWFVFEIMFKLK